MGLPIMMFDERKLTPSFGYVFNPKWLDPEESIVSILWKLARMNYAIGCRDCRTDWENDDRSVRWRRPTPR